MAKIYSTLKSTTGKTSAPQLNERFYTDVPQGTKPNSKLQLTIEDRWLEQIRFYTGSLVIIKIEQHKLEKEIFILY